MSSLDWGEKDIRVDRKLLSNLRFAADIVIFAKSTSEADTAELDEAGRKIGLRINRKRQFLTNYCGGGCDGGTWNSMDLVWPKRSPVTMTVGQEEWWNGCRRIARGLVEDHVPECLMCSLNALRT
ncbi:unnamed protein product [Nippostrongylus brasiliensis]|uniref:Reverse transcriptase domain-containing protein n=1 Tax=Nippostrongylus brasiliensis TaxID=27835 RepID=A0A0N4XPB9_NIPBR|nr:unnamed protein product [Nippostrongylus brasiliensis]